MGLISLNIKGISYSQTRSGAYALILEEESGERRLPIIIGSFEAQSIAIALENEIKPPRPLTHDLFKSMTEELKTNLDYIHIHKLIDGVFYSSLVFTDIVGNTFEIDSRTSDAVALAVRFNSPIYTSEEILERAGILLENIDEDMGDDMDDDTEEVFDAESITTELEGIMDDDFSYKDLTITDLNKLLSEAVRNEDYELAARLRDELDKRESSN